MPVLNFCRFDTGGNLTSHQAEIQGLRFIAISHTWADASWLNVPKIPFPILATTHKAKFIVEKLPDIVKNEYFWMDILSVDQSSKQSRSSVVEHIPMIYKSASLTVVIREPGGILSCCSDILQLQDPETLTPSISTKKQGLTKQHLDAHHPHGLKEQWIERLWPLQELHLSDTVLFAVCNFSDGPLRESGTRSTANVVEPSVTYFDLYWLASQWSTTLHASEDRPSVRKQVQKKTLDDFLRAILNNGRVTRNIHEAHPSAFHVLSESAWSRRRTGKDRDFILALFPQFSWYQVPSRQRLKEMEFSDTFEDCMAQVQHLAQNNPDSNSWDARLFTRREKQNWPSMIIRPKIVQGLLKGFNADSKSSWTPSTEVPLPETLSDFSSLMHFYTDVDGEYPFVTPMNYEWELHPIGADHSPDTILRALNSTAFFSRSQFTTRSTEEFMSGEKAVELEQILDYKHSNCFMQNHQNLITGPHQPYLPVPYDIWLGIEFLHLQVKNNNDSLHKTRKLLSPRVYLSEKWTQIINQFQTHDSPELRESLLLLMAASRCGFRVQVLPWIRARLRPYLLQLKGLRGQVVFETLILGAKDLDVSRVGALNAFLKKSDPYVTSTTYHASRSREERVIGLAPVVERQDQDMFGLLMGTDADLASYFNTETLKESNPQEGSSSIQLNIHSCEVCNGTENLEKCSGCQSVGHCSKECRSSDWPNHQKACEMVQKLPALNISGPTFISTKTSLSRSPAPAPPSSGPPLNLYRYQPLRPSFIRLLRLHPGNSGEPLRCDIQHDNIDCAPPYVALSYHCTEKQTSEHLLVGDGSHIPITCSLFHALRDIRDFRVENRTYTIWAEGACINSEDIDERAHHAPLMFPIYRQATVISYIGPEAENSRLGLAFALELLDWRVKNPQLASDLRLNISSMGPDIGLPTENDPKWATLRSLISRRWPGQIWMTVQFLLSQDYPTVKCGRQTIHGMILPYFAREAKSGGLPVRALRTTNHENSNAADGLVNLAYLRPSVWTEMGRPALCLHHLLNICQGYGNDDPRDIVFALLNLAADRVDLGIKPDYSATVAAVYTQTAGRIMMKNQSLVILGQIGSKKVPGLPSWVPDWTVKRGSVPFSYLDMPPPGNLTPEDQERRRAQYIYHAGGNRKPEISILDGSSRLTIRGGIIDRIHYLSSEIIVSEMMRGMEWTQWLDVNRSYCKHIMSYHTKEKVKDAFWMTLLGGKTHTGAEATLAYRRYYDAFVEAASDGFIGIRTPVPSGDLQRLAQLYEKRQVVLNVAIALMKMAEERRWCVTKGRLLGTKGRLMGLVPRESREGDVIFVPFGSQVPLLLRECGSDYTLVGECYIHGIMKGEALAFPHFKARDVHLV